MGKRMHYSGAVGAIFVAAHVSGDTNDDSRGVDSSSTDSMADIVVPGFEGYERNDDDGDGDGGSQREEGDSLDNDEWRSTGSGSTGSLAEIIAPEGEMEDGEEFEAMKHNDYEDESSTDEDEEEDDRYNDRNEDGDDDRDNRGSEVAEPKRAGSYDICDAPSGHSLLVGCLHDAVSCLEILVYAFSTASSSAPSTSPTTTRPSQPEKRKLRAPDTWKYFRVPQGDTVHTPFSFAKSFLHGAAHAE